MNKTAIKILVCFIMSFTLLFGLQILPAQADLGSEITGQTDAFAGERGAGLGEARDPRIVVALIIRYLLGLIGILFIGYAIYGGFLIMTSAGEEEKVNKGKSTLRTAIIGVIITLSAYSILWTVYRIAFPQIQGPGIYFWQEPDQSDYYNPDPTR